MVQFFFDRVENTVEKERMLVTSIFFFYHNVFNFFSLGLLDDNVVGLLL